MPGARKVFRLEAVLEASVDELYDLLFVRVEEMHQWNPSIQHIKVSAVQLTGFEKMSCSCCKAEVIL